MTDLEDEEKWIENNTKYYNFNPSTYIDSLPKNKTENIENQIHSFMILMMFLHPKSRDNIKLNNNNPYIDPIINPNYLYLMKIIMI